MDILKFLEDNRLKKTDLASFLGVVPSAVSAFIKAGRLPAKHFAALESNPNGWDTTALLDVSAPARAEDPLALVVETLRNECEALRDVIARQDALIARFDALLRLYMEKDGKI